MMSVRRLCPIYLKATVWATGESRSSAVRWKRVLAGFGVVGVVGVICAASFGCWLITPNNHQATLVKLDVPGLAKTPCLGQGATLISGRRLDFNVEWVTEDDLVSVLNKFTRQGWYVISAGPSVALLPPRQSVINLWLFQIPTPRAVSLEYTEDHDTRLTESISMILCPPVF